MRALILAPTGRDARLLAGTVEEIRVDAEIAADLPTLLSMLDEGVGTSIIADEALDSSSFEALARWHNGQPPWSDPGFIVLTASGRPTPATQVRGNQLSAMGNCTFIERPARPETIQSAVRSALRARMRQYEIRSGQEALVRANGDLEQFAHSAGHDLREPLRNIGLYGDLLSKDYGQKLDERGNELLAFIRANVDRMEALLRDLLLYAQMSDVSDEEVEFGSSKRALEMALENLESSLKACRAHIDIGEMPEVRIRESHLCQIFQNLVGNAIKYCESQPKIVIRCQREANDWLFSVSDNGIGIDPEYRETIFGIFKRLHPQDRYSGTGMGLAICQRLIERYRGRIWVTSQPGKGSTFFFTIPATAADQ